MSNNLSAYLHIPFCEHRCSYCDFNTYTSLMGLKEAYTAALCREIIQVAGEEKRLLHTIFFGGGTPSLLSVASFAQILETLYERFEVSPTAEITIEANPETVDEAYLSALLELGINRLSFGAQSAVESELSLLGRQHTFERVAEVVNAAQAVGFEDCNIDLIYGVPGQTLASWRASLTAALALPITHLSLYCLTIEPGTPMQRMLRAGEFAPPDGDLAADQYELAAEMMAARGFEHYEISNWALPGRECQHNLTYWRNEEYLGLGAGAHGHAAGYRYHVVKQPRVYMRRLQSDEAAAYPWSAAVAEKTQLSKPDQMAETMMMGLRLLNEGVSYVDFKTRFGQDLAAVYGSTIDELVQWGLLEKENGRLRLTERGRFVSNQVFYRFI